jgi:hypothetical protein
MPQLPPNHGCWRLVHREHLSCKGFEGKEAKVLAVASAQMIDELHASGGKIPWKKLAVTDHILAIGLEWETGP